MNPDFINAQKALVNFYREHYEQHGRGPRALDMADRNSQDSRFAVLAGVLPPGGEKFSVLDVGCGFGDLLEFLNKKGCSVEYTGIDILPDFIDEAKKSWPEAEFISGDFLEMEFDKKFDYVLCSGTLNVLLADSPAWTREMIAKMAACASGALAFNMTSIYTDEEYKNDHTFYADPAEVFTFCRTLVKPVVLLHNYRPNDFTIYMYKGGYPD